MEGGIFRNKKIVDISYQSGKHSRLNASSGISIKKENTFANVSGAPDSSNFKRINYSA